MTTHDRVSVNANGDAVQIYFKKAFACDSAFPFDAGDDAVAYVTPDGGLHIIPLDSFVDVARDYPISVDAPPPAALPPEHRWLTNGHTEADHELHLDTDP